MGILLYAVLLGLIPATVARHKGRSFLAWWAYGSAILPVALPHALLLKPDVRQVERQQLAQGLRKCPFCAEMSKPDATVCRYCNRDLPEPAPPPARRPWFGQDGWRRRVCRRFASPRPLTREELFRRVQSRRVHERWPMDGIPAPQTPGRAPTAARDLLRRISPGAH
jgi:hypothetical protein